MTYCEICNKELKSNQKRFCSLKCLGKWNSLVRIGENSPTWKGGKVRKKCEVCNETFEVVQAQNNQRFCSYKCYGLWQRVNRIGTANPRFNEYSRRQLTSYVLNRDNNQCRICGSKRYLDTHHIYNKNDFPELKNDRDNMITLCKSCHKKYEGNEYIGLFDIMIDYMEMI